MRRLHPLRKIGVRRVAKQGNTLVEYGLIAALIGVAGMASLMGLSGAMSQQFQNLAGMNRPVIAVKPAATAPAGSLSLAGTTLNAGMLANVSAQQTATAAKQQGMQGQIQTLGANGSTALMADQLRQAAQTLLAQGDITPAQSSLILQMANQGHLMAQAEALIEAQAAKGDPAAFKSNNIQFNGKTYSAYSLSRELGYASKSVGDFPDPLNIPSSEQTGLLKPFLTTYQKLLSGGALNNPAVAEIVQNASSQIVVLTEMVNESSTNYNAKSPFNDNMASQTTRVQSSKVCQAGPYRDTGTICQ